MSVSAEPLYLEAPAAALSAQPFRVAGKGRVDLTKPITFSFDGKPITGFVGDTVASALLAQGVHFMGRSFKYHRPRGPVTAGSEEPNALIGTWRGPGRYEPNTRATMAEVYEGLKATSQNRWPSLTTDIGVVNDALSPLFSAGFYYKTFLWPASFWRSVYEPAIRRAAGLGVAPCERDPDDYVARYHHTDILVVGAGPAGIAAALTAARAGANVTLVDEHAEIGGALLSHPEALVNDRAAWTWLGGTVNELAGLGVTVLPRTTAIAYDHQNMVACVERLTDHLASPPEGAPRERLWRVRAGHVVLAQGAIEKPLVFQGNDRPGIMLAGAALTYLERFGVAVCERPIIVTSHDSAYQTAFALQDAGATINAILDVRSDVPPHLCAELERRRIPLMNRTVPTATAGRTRVHALEARDDWHTCDALLMCGGWTPNVALFSHTKGKLVWDAASAAFLPSTTNEALTTAGAGAGVWGLAAALNSGSKAGAAAASAFGHMPAADVYSVAADHEGSGQAHGLLSSTAPQNKAFVDFQNDVTAKDIKLAVREGFHSIEHVKRYTTNGMATDQGKLSNINALMIAAEALGRMPPEVGLTTFRPPYTPTTFATLANHHRGAGFDIVRKTPIDPWAEAKGAVFEPVALWRRARYFPRSGETMRQAVARECRVTRDAVGIFDASTLGKIELVGPDAATFLELLYTNPFQKLAVGRCRYAVMLGEDGYIRDDGVIARIAEDRFHVTTTTGGAPRVLSHMEDWLQTEVPHLKVWATSTTEQWATIALNGPCARHVLASLVDGIDISAASFPHMSVADATVADVPARLMRVSFTGEVGFEVNVPADQALAVWNALWAAGEPYGMVAYGTETMHVLRAEKGYIIVGQDTDGTVTPADAGLDWAIGKKKADFVGKRSLSRPDLVAPQRKQLVGLLSRDPYFVLPEGAQIVANPSEPVPMTMIGHVTSAYWSAALGRSIALALVAGGRERIGKTLHVPLTGRSEAVTVVTPVFYDAEGTRLNG